MEEEGPDFISSLPRDVILHIASMIPRKVAIRTAVLSSIWRSFWQPVPVNLEFSSAQISCSGACREKLKLLLGLVLKSYNYPEKFKFCLESGDDIKKIAENSKVKDEFLAIITKAIDRELHFDFSGPELLTSKFNLILEPGTLFCPSFTSLKSLRLRLVTHGTEILVKDLLSSCQFLENLSLEKCNGGVLPNLELVNTSHLAQVELNLRDDLGQNCFDCEDVLSLLSSLKDVEILTLRAAGFLSGCAVQGSFLVGWISNSTS